MDVNATNKGKILESAALGRSPLGAPEVQLYLAVDTEMKTRFLGGMLGNSAPPQPSP